MDCHHHICSIVPTYLLESLCHCEDEEVRQSAHATLAFAEALHTNRHDFFEAKCSGHHGRHGGHRYAPQGIVPGALLQAVIDSSETDDATKAAAKENLDFSQQVRDDRAAAAVLAAELGSTKGSQDTETGFFRGVYNMENRGDVEDSATFNLLPGTEARMEGEDATADEEVNEAYDMGLEVLKFYKQFFDHDSLDGRGMTVVSSVHFGQKLGNAFWLSWMGQMVYGDGNSFLHNFTGCIDVIGHEMTVSITHFTFTP